MRSLHLTSVAGLRTIPTGGDMAIFGACSMPHGLQGFLPHLSGYVGGHQHGAECARSSKTLSSGKGAKASVSVPLRSHRQAESQDCWTRFGGDDACLVATHSHLSSGDHKPHGPSLTGSVELSCVTVFVAVTQHCLPSVLRRWASGLACHRQWLERGGRTNFPCRPWLPCFRRWSASC